MFQFYTKTNQKKPLSIKKDSDLDYSLWEREESMNWGGGGAHKMGWGPHNTRPSYKPIMPAPKQACTPRPPPPPPPPAGPQLNTRPSSQQCMHAHIQACTHRHI